MIRLGSRTLLVGMTFLIWAAVSTSVGAQTVQIAYAGSMGVVMDRFLGPDFARAHSAKYQGIGHGSYGLARLVLSGQIRPDAFVSVTRGPIELLLQAGRMERAVPFAGTEMVITYNPKGRFADRFKQAAAGTLPWYSLLETPGLRFGRTDPSTDPQGRNIVFTFMLAERYYHAPDLVKKILGAPENPAQIFTETSLLSRLEAGQLDASSGYRSAAVSHGLPFVTLPPEINLGNDEYAKNWYSTVSFSITGPNGKKETLHTQPLVFYAGVPVDARHPESGRAFVAYLQSSSAQAVLRSHGYGPPSGPVLR